jgi:hypothetical protein
MALIAEQGRPLEFILREANGWRSREVALIGIVGTAPQPAVTLPPGTLLQPAVPATTPATWLPALPGDEANISAILAYPVDTRVDQQEVTVIARDCEVNGSYLRWVADAAAVPPAGDLDRVAATAALLASGIIVREGIFTESAVVMGAAQPPPVLP